MILGITASQPLPHRWRGEPELLDGGGVLSSSALFGLGGTMRATFAGLGSIVPKVNYLNMRATFAGAGSTAWNAGRHLRSSALWVGAGNMSAIPFVVPITYQGSVAFDGAGLMSSNAWGDAAAFAFLARTTGLNATHINAYGNLITDLVVDGVWAKLDALWVFATQDEATALLNLVSASFPMVKTLTPTFTADQGFAGNSTNFITGPALNGLSQYTQNSAHLMMWDLTSGGSINRLIDNNNAATCQTHIHSRFSDNKAYYRLNHSTATSAQGVTVASTKGSYIASRTASNATAGYKNGSSVLADTVASGALTAAAITIPATPSNVSTDQCAAASVGTALTATDALNLHNRLVTYFQAVGIGSPT